MVNTEDSWARHFTGTVCPLVLQRRAGIGIAEVRKLSSPSLAMRLAACEKCADIASQVVRTCVDALHSAIGSELDPDHRRSLLNLKRAVYNVRTEEVEKFVAGHRTEDAPLIEKLHELLKARFAASALDMDTNAYIHMEICRELDHLASFVSGDVFMKAGPLSAPVLLDRLLRKGIKKVLSDDKDAYTIFRFFTRAGAKVSPFSHFGQVRWLLPDSLLEASLQEEPFSGVRAEACLNVRLLGYIRSAQLLNAEFRDKLWLRCNPTIERVKDKFHFLLQRPGEEVFSSIQVGGLLETTLNVVGSKAIAYADLRAKIATLSPLSCAGGDCDKTILKLVTAGFLVIEWPVSGSDVQWEDQMLKNLNECGGEALALMWSDILKQVRHIPQESGLVRMETINRLRDSISKFLVRSTGGNGDYNLADAGEFLKSKQLIFENVELAPGTSAPILARWDYVERDLNRLLDVLRPIAPEVIKLDGMVDTFVDWYGANASIRAISFFERVRRNPIKVPESSLLVIDQFNKSLDTAFDAADISYSQVTVQSLQPISIGSSRHEVVSDLAASQHYAASIQYSTSVPSALVLNGIGPGAGQRIARFIPKENDQLRRAFSTWVEQTSQGVKYTELQDPILFNANLHSALVADQIVPPGAERLPRLSNDVVDINDVYMQHDNTDNSIRLITQKGKARLYPEDFGLLALENRSALFRFLLNFRRTPTPDLWAIRNAYDSWVERKVAGDGAVRRYPRLMLGQYLILLRQKWIMRPCHIRALFDESSTELGALLSIRKWLERWEIPMRFYIALERADGVNEKRGGPGREKPQYIDVESMFAVRLLRTLCRRNVGSLIITEADPSPCVGPDPDINEYIVHWWVSAADALSKSSSIVQERR